MLGVYGVFRGYFVGVRCIINNPFAAKWQAVSSRRGRFIVPVYTCSPHIRKTLGHICNPFETHLCNVRNVFVICVLHIRRVKVWFLRCKSMVFGVQKGGFALQKYGFCFLNVVLLQSVSNIIGRLSAAVGTDLSRPHIGIHPQNDERKHVCGEMDTRIQ